MSTIWKIWCRAIGDKAFEEDNRKSDVVAVIRTFWIILHILTCLAIITNAIANHGILGLLGLGT
jgi:hypothetical protein